VKCEENHKVKRNNERLFFKVKKTGSLKVQKRTQSMGSGKGNTGKERGKTREESPRHGKIKKLRQKTPCREEKGKTMRAQHAQKGGK